MRSPARNWLLPLLALALPASISCSTSSVADTADDDGSDEDGKDDGTTSLCSPTSARSPKVTVSVTPAAGEAPIVAVVNGAKSSLRVMVYILDAGDILDAIVAKQQAGVQVQAILDKSEQQTNQPAFDALTAAGAQVEWSDPQFSYMHAKFLVADGKDALVATGNFSKKLLARERNYLVHDRDPHDVQSLVTLFDADFARQVPEIGCTRLLVSPVNSKDRLVALIQAAKTSIAVESMQLADADVRQALVDAYDRGVDVRVLLAAASWISGNTAAASTLADNGIEARYLSTPMIHVKNIIVDGKRAYLGSENLSSTSLEKNREVGVIDASDTASLATIKATFEADWQAATSF